MAEWTYPVDTEHNIYLNMTVYKRLRDGVLNGWRILPNDGYVVYDRTAEDTEHMKDENGDPIWDEENGGFILVPVTYYSLRVELPANYNNWDNFEWVAVPRTPEIEDYIFGAPAPDHEIA